MSANTGLQSTSCMSAPSPVIWCSSLLSPGYGFECSGRSVRMAIKLQILWLQKYRLNNN